MNVAIVGAGKVGAKRAAALGGSRLVAVADRVADRAASLARSYDAEVFGDWRRVVDRSDVDAVIVSTTHDALVPCARAALAAGKHVLVEKPGGIEPLELIALRERAAEQKELCVRVGFNHRFHPALMDAKRLVSEGRVGRVFGIRGRYGHGGRLGYEKEWRCDPARAGGGELMDQGVHLIDLCRWLAGEMKLAHSRIATCFWASKVEDNGFLHLMSPDRRVSCWLHASWTEWKNLFSLEIAGEKGKLEVSGLGASYGEETLVIHQMRPELGPPDTEILRYPGEDASWAREWSAFEMATKGETTENAIIDDGLRAVELVHDAYLAGGAPWVQAKRGSARGFHECFA